MDKITIVNFADTKIANVSGLHQYDYGQILRIQGLNLPTAVEIHFALQEKGGDSITRVGITKDSVTDVVIPDSMLENSDTNRDYNIYAFIYLTDDVSGQTEYKIRMMVQSRPRPEAFNRPEDAKIFREAIRAVNESAKESKRWAIGDENVPGSEKDNAKYYSEESKKIADDVKTEGGKIVNKIVEQNQKAEQNITSLDENIKNAEKSKESLKETITTSGTAIEKVNEAIKNADTAKDAADTATLETNKAAETANTAKMELGNATTQANELKIALDKSIGEVAKDATGLQILTVLQKGSELLGQIAKVVEETAGKAGSLNGFGLNLLEDGSVSLTYTNPETNQLEASAIFPKDSTGKKLSKALGEMNDHLKVIALREGGKA